MTAPLTTAELRAIEEKLAKLSDPFGDAQTRRAVRANVAADLVAELPRLIATVKLLRAYREACWVYEPEGDSGFDRVNAATAVFTVVREWLITGRIALTEDDDPESFYECLRDAEFLGLGLLRACRAESDAGLTPLTIAPTEG